MNPPDFIIYRMKLIYNPNELIFVRQVNRS